MKKVISVILATVMLLSFAGAVPVLADTVASGICGESLTWVLDSDDVLTISGTGEMTEWDSASDAPWYAYKTNVVKVVIGEGVTSVGYDSFYNYDCITEVVFPSTLKTIADWAFNGCDALKAVTIPPSVENISWSSFPKLESITGYKYSAAEIYANQEEIAFISLGELPEAVLSSGECGEGVIYTLTNRNVLTISGSGATAAYEYEESPWFPYMNRVQTVIIEDGITAIGDGTFNGCIHINDLTIPEGVTSIGAMAFFGCNYVESLVLPSTLKTIGENAFNSIGVIELLIPDGVTTIGAMAFAGAPTTSVTIPESVTSIGAEAFGDGYTNCVIKGVKGSYAETYASENGYSFVGTFAEPILGTWGDNLTWVLDTDGTFTLSGKGEMEYGSNHFSYSWWDYEDAMSTIIIETGITSISSRAFYGCSNINSVTIPYTVSSIGSYAFYAAPETLVVKGYNGTKAEIFATNNNFTFESLGDAPRYEVASGTCGDAVTWVLDSYGLLAISGKGEMLDWSYSPNSAPWYSYRTSVEKVVVGEGVTSIGAFAFSDCENITEAALPTTLTSIGEYAFADCYYLPTVTVPVSVVLIEENAFLNCSAYNSSSFVIKGYTPSAAEDFATENYYTFESLGAAPVVAIASGSCGENLTWTLDNYGLLKITGTGAMSYGSTDEEVGGNVGEDVGGVELMEVYSDDVPWYSYTSVIKTVEISEGVTTIADYAFYNCDKITEVDLPESIVSIGESAFSYCDNLGKVSIHYNTTDIKETAFRYSYNVVMHGFNYSAAEAYATEHSVEFVSIGEAPLATVVSGDVTDTITWSLDNRGVLAITGTGEMPEYTFNGPRPWDDYRAQIKTVEINGVDRVYEYTISQCDNLTSVVLNNVGAVDSFAFHYCSYITEATISPETNKMGDRAFYYNASSMTIKGVENSYAQMYAESVGSSFEAIEGSIAVDTVYVSTVDELIAAIASNRIIVMQDGIYLLDKTATLGDVNYTWEYADILKIEDVSNLTIKAQNPGKVEIISAQTADLNYYSYQNSVLYIANAYNLTIEGIRLGNMQMHTNYGSVPKGDEAELMGGYDEYAMPDYYGTYITTGSNGSGDYVTMPNKVNFVNCDLFNSTFAIYFSGESLTVDNCTLRDNVQGAIFAPSGEVLVKNSTFSRNGNSAAYKSTYCLSMNGTVNNSIFINNGNEYFSSTDITQSENLFSNNTWDSEPMKAYGITQNGITWQVADSDGENVLKLGYTINTGNITLESELGGVYPYSVNSVPWKEYEIDSVMVSDGVSYNEFIWGACGKAVTWKYIPTTKTLTLYGTGDMSNIDVKYTWGSHGNDIEKITIADTVTGVYNRFIDTAYYANEQNWENGILYIGDVLVKAKNDTKGEVTVKEGTRVVADEAFYGCKLITKIVLPETVEHIGVTETLSVWNYSSEGAFADCESLVSLTIPVAVTELDHVVTDGCNALKDIYYSGTTAQWKSIKLGMRNEQLAYCTIHTSDGVIEPPAYSYEITDNGAVITAINPTAESIVIPVAVEGVPVVEFEYGIFMKNNSVKTIVIEANVEAAPAFTNCKNLESVTLGNGVKYIFYNTFEGCEKLASITLGDEIVELSANAFDGTAYYSNANNWDGSILYVDGYAAALAPDAAGKITVRSDARGVSYNIFSNNNAVTEVVVPEGVKMQNVGECFYNMSALRSVTLPETFTVGKYGFGVYDCGKLEAITISENNPDLTSVEGVVFTKDMTTLVYMPMGRGDSYTIPDGVTTIAEGAFADTHLSNLTIPASVNYISDSAFPYSYYLSDVYYNITAEQWENIYTGNIYIGNGNVAFDAANLHLLNYEVIKETLDYSLSDDGTYYIVTGCKDYATEAFVPAMYDSLPVAEVDSYAFWNKTNLSEITVDEESEYFTAVDGVLFTKDMTTLVAYPAGKADESYTLPEGVKAIAAEAFAYSKNLKAIDLGNELTSIGMWAFENSGITSVIIPETVTSLPCGAFDTSSLEKVYFGTHIQSIESGAFYYQLKYIYFDGTKDEWYNVNGHYYISDETTIVTKVEIVSHTDAVREDEGIVVNFDVIGADSGQSVIAIGLDENGIQLTYDEISGEWIYFGQIVIDGQSEETEAPNQDVLDNVKEVKIFVWESVESMRPLGEPIIVKVAN